MASTMTLDPRTKNPLNFLFSEDDPYACFKSIQRQIELIEIQEEHVKDQQENLKHELSRSEQEVKTVPLVIGHFMEMIDTNNGSPIGINYYDRILSTVNREMLKLVASVAVRHHSSDVLPPEADSSISLLSHSEKPDVTYSMDGFDQTVNVKVIMATNRADTLDPALLHPGRLDCKIEFPLPDKRQKRLVFQVCTAKMNLSVEVDLEDFVSRPDKISAAEIMTICQEAEMHAVRKKRYVILPKDFEMGYRTNTKKSDTDFDFHK